MSQCILWWNLLKWRGHTYPITRLAKSTKVMVMLNISWNQRAAVMIALLKMINFLRNAALRSILAHKPLVYAWKNSEYFSISHIFDGKLFICMQKFIIKKCNRFDYVTKVVVRPLYHPQIMKFELFVCKGFLSHLRVFHSYGDVTILVKGCKYLPMLSTHGYWAVKVL